MSEILTVETPTTDTTPNTPLAPAPGISEAGAALRANGWDTPAVPVVEPVAPAAPVVPPVVPAEPAEPAEPVEQTYTQDEAGRWHRPDGQFANAEEIAKLDALPADGSQDTAPVEPVPEPIVVSLKGRRGEEREIEVTDPEIAELLRANAKDGMRREEFVRQHEALQVDRAGIEEFKTALRTNPESVILREMPQDKQVSVLIALLAQHWDVVIPQLQAFDANPSERITAAMQAQLAIRDQQSATDSAIQSSRYSAQVYTAVNALVPDTIADEVREQFISDAAADVARAIQANGKQPIAIEKIPEVLARRVALYRFSEANSLTPGATPQAPAAPVRPVARPLARSATTPAAPALTVANGKASATSTTVRRTVQAQRIAAAVAPQGAGAATIHAPLVPKDATVEGAGKLLRTQRGWGPPAA